MNRENSDQQTLARLLRQYKKVVEENKLLGVALHDQAGKNLYGNLFEVHGDLLAPVLKNGNDLQDLFAVMLDYKASYDVTGQMLPDTVLSRFISAKSDPGKLGAESGINTSCLRKRLLEQPRNLLRFLSLAENSVIDAVRDNINVIDAMICSKRDAQALVGLLAVTVNNSLVNVTDLLGVLVQVATIAGKKVAADVFNLVRVLISEHTPLVDSEIWLPGLADSCDSLGSDDYLALARFMQCGSLVKILKNTVGCSVELLKFWDNVKELVTVDSPLFVKIEAVFSRACFPEMTRDNFTLLCREITTLVKAGRPLESMQLPFVLPPPVVIVDTDAMPPEISATQPGAILVRRLPASPDFPANALLRHVEVEWQGTKVTFAYSELVKIFERDGLLPSGEPSYTTIEAVFAAARRLCQNAPELVARLLTTETLGIRRTELVNCLSHMESKRRYHDGPRVLLTHDEYM